MKRSTGLWSLWGFSVTSLSGTLLHFLYDWLEGTVWIAPFSGVNESTWEHMKLLFWPMFFFALIQWAFFGERENFWCIKLKGILLGLSLIPIIFYAYNGVIGKSPDWINVTIFFVSAATVYIYEVKQFKVSNSVSKYPKLALFMLFTIAFLFVIFTFKAPRINIFKDPITSFYGI